MKTERFGKSRMGLSLLVVLAMFSFFLSSIGFCQSPSSLNKGIDQYNNENYEEAIELLLKTREADPESSAAAFFLGLAYKQVMDYPKAISHLRDAVTLKPKIKEALVELIDVALQLEKLEEAGKWIDVAEESKIFPAKVAFLKGMLLKKGKKSKQAIESFKKAKELDASTTQSAEFQIALCYVQQHKLKKAKEGFQAAVLHAPQTDLGAYARRYQDLVEERIFLERPLRFTVGAFGMNDTNVIVAPEGGPAAMNITDEASSGLGTNFRVDYVPQIEGPWLFNAQYSFNGNFYHKHSTTHNFVSNSLYIAPGYDFGDQALNFIARYSYGLVGSSAHRYLNSLELGPLYRRSIGQNQILEIFGGYSREGYFQPPVSLEEDRDSNGWLAYLSWIWTLKNRGFLNLRYEYATCNTDGSNWDNDSHKLSANVLYPLSQSVDLQASGQAQFQNYDNIHSFTQIALFGPPRSRDDSIYQGSIGLTWEFMKRTKLIAQITRIRDDSNLSIYDYARSLYILGVEYRF